MTFCQLHVQLHTWYKLLLFVIPMLCWNDHVPSYLLMHCVKFDAIDHRLSSDNGGTHVIAHDVYRLMGIYLVLSCFNVIRFCLHDNFRVTYENITMGGLLHRPVAFIYTSAYMISSWLLKYVSYLLKRKKPWNFTNSSTTHLVSYRKHISFTDVEHKRSINVYHI